MDVVPGTPAKYRVPDAIHPLTGAVRADRRPEYVERPMPAAAAVRWAPIEQPAGDAVYPILITQRALAAVHAHLAAGSEGASSFGFLVGDVYIAPETGFPYVIGESTVDVPWSIAGGHLKSALLQGREIAMAEARRRGGRVVGWYHCHVAADARLSVADVEAHLACFNEPWQVALVVARGDDLKGGVFRVQAEGARVASEYLPFYELPNEQRGTSVAWVNYRSHTVVLAPAVASASVAAPGGAAPGGGAQQLVLLPDESDIYDELDFKAPAALPRPRFEITPAVRYAALAAAAVMALAVLVVGYRALSAGPSDGANAGGIGATPRARVGDLADSTAYSVTAFGVRARLFDGRKMVCADLARGLVEVEERWTAYTAARAVASATVDAAQVATDQRLHTDVNAVEQRFARTGCPRP
jgi:proteasome lid subunit RPN8/RPN11